MGNSIISVYICVCLQLKWLSFIYIRNRTGPSARSPETHRFWLTGDLTLSTHPRYTEICLNGMIQISEELCLLRHIEPTFAEVFIINNIKSFFEVEEYCSNNVPLIDMTTPIVYQFNQCGLPNPTHLEGGGGANSNRVFTHSLDVV